MRIWDMPKLKAIAREKGGDCLSMEYQGVERPLTWQCSEGHTWEAPPKRIIDGAWCKQCSHKSRRLTNEVVVNRFQKAHGDRYDYSEVNFKTDRVPVTIICTVHGRFQQRADVHWKGGHCRQCALLERDRKRIQRAAEAFESRARKSHGDRYDYSQVEFKGAREKVTIICKRHGSFEQTASEHIGGKGCAKCATEENGRRIRKKSREEFESKARAVHGKKYEYSQVRYRTGHEPVIITCHNHGDFEQSPSSHLAGHGCPQCGVKTMAAQQAQTGKKQFFKQAKEVHGDRYDYSESNYIRSHRKITITCPDHGNFSQTPNNHLRGNGCPDCALEVRANKRRTSLEEFVSRSREIHGGKFGYSQVDYQNCATPVIITCPKHGEFLQTPNAHLCGKGCASCNESTGERAIARYLEQNGIEHERQFVIEPAHHPYRYDFFVPSRNLLVEFHGDQHYQPSDFFGGKEGLKRTRKRDKRKRRLAKKKGFRLLVIPHWKIDEIPKIIESPCDFMKDWTKSRSKVFDLNPPSLEKLERKT